MKKSLTFIPLTVLELALMAGCGTPAATTTTAAAAGQSLYQANCALCHGSDGAGGVKVENATAPDIRFAALNDTYKGDFSLVSRSILDGKDEAGKDLDPAMPRFRGKLSDADVTAIVDYLKTLR